MGEGGWDKERDQGGSSCRARRVLYLRARILTHALGTVPEGASPRSASHASCDQTEKEARVRRVVRLSIVPTTTFTSTGNSIILGSS